MVRLREGVGYYDEAVDGDEEGDLEDYDWVGAKYDGDYDPVDRYDQYTVDTANRWGPCAVPRSGCRLSLAPPPRPSPPPGPTQPHARTRSRSPCELLRVPRARAHTRTHAPLHHRRVKGVFNASRAAVRLTDSLGMPLGQAGLELFQVAIEIGVVEL